VSPSPGESNKEEPVSHFRKSDGKQVWRADQHWVEIAYRTRTKTHKKNQEEKLSLELRKSGAQTESSANEFPSGS
jgi:hypothetical protein